MSLSGHFNNKHVQEERQAKQEAKPVRFFEDFPAATRRLDDGTPFRVRGGKIVPGSLEPASQVKESKYVAKADVPTPESKFYKETLISTILETKREGEKDSVGEKEAVASVRKPIDVNRKSLKL